MNGLRKARNKQRQCVSCGVSVRNPKLGGHSGKSALSGVLWCATCADLPQQLMLKFGR
jgi:hypothetical protein